MPDLDAMIKAKLAAAADLLKRPGVTGVGVGYREKGGQLTDEHAIRVYVEHKRPLNEIPAEYRIPTEIAGFKTDVIEKGHDVLVSLENKRVRPLVGGLEISRMQPGVKEAYGSICCFVDKRTKTASGAYEITTGYMLTAAHVLEPPGGALNDAVYQARPIDLCAEKADINWGNDAGLARLGTNVTCKNDIYDVGPIGDIGDPVRIDQQVRKQGKTTGLTTGIISDLSYSYFNIQVGKQFSDLFKFTPLKATEPFCDHGDSGGPVFTGRQDIRSNPPVLIGLVHGIQSKGPAYATAVKITNVFNFNVPNASEEGPIRLLWAGRSRQGDDVDRSKPMSLGYEGPTEIIARDPTKIIGGDVILGKWTANGENGDPYTFAVDPALPPDFRLSPAGIFSGSTDFGGLEWKGNVTATDRAGIKSAPVAWELKIIPRLFVANGQLPDAFEGKFYSFQLQAFGGTEPYTFQSFGVANGLTLNSRGLVSGTPGPGSGTGQYRGCQLSDGVTDAKGQKAELAIAIRILPPR